MIHKHAWKFVERGTGVYEKGKQLIRVEVPGHLSECACADMMFFPDDRNLRPVKVTVQLLNPSSK